MVGKSDFLVVSPGESNLAACDEIKLSRPFKTYFRPMMAIQTKNIGIRIPPTIRTNSIGYYPENGDRFLVPQKLKIEP